MEDDYEYISNHEQFTRDNLPIWKLDVGLITPHNKRCNILQIVTENLEQTLWYDVRNRR